ncbi:uncharacterized protein LOC129745455 [Uranotaenia lowii]|uniref:uncharacterized protein LOC129745455 n=1 Tax=Uranotaenia lowii TaxID=190385 RepID=UPI002479A840|nr:uncharacterized protein LOC129745455 [Uranotaenia lowii]
MRSIILIFMLNLSNTKISIAEDTKTFPGAEIIIPAIIGQIIPAIIGGGAAPQLPSVSISHTGSIATSVANTPIAISQSGTISTSGSSQTHAASQAMVKPGGSVSASSHVGNHRRLTANPSFGALSKRLQKFLKNVGR